MQLPQGNPYKELLMQKMEGLITQAQLETEIAKDAASKPVLYAYEPLPLKPDSLMNYYTLSEDKQDKVWKELQYHPDIMKYTRIVLKHDRNIYALKHFIDCLVDFPDEQLKLKQRLALYGQPEVVSVSDRALSDSEQEVLRQWGGSVAD